MVKTSFVWVSAMFWHLWRIATLRPAFKQLSDTGPMAGSFILVYFLAGVLRWWILNPDESSQILKVLFGLFIYLILILAIFERSNRSSSMSAVALGVSAAVDLVVSGAYLLGMLDSVVLPDATNLGIESVWILMMFYQFTRQPEAIRMRGYRLSDTQA